jgi:muramoyltetrapeptide carboxypeptidase
LRGRGLDVEEAPGIDAVRGDTAGDDAARAAAVGWALERKAKTIWFARGGYGATRLLPLLEIDRLAASGAAVIGYSDATALLWPVADRRGRAVHGPMVETLAGLDSMTARALDDLVFGAGRHEAAFAVPGRWLGRPPAGGALEGSIRAANLSVIAALCGTPWAPEAAKTRGSVVFLEDVNEPTYKIDRALTQCLQAGVFDGAAGVAFGSFQGCAPRPAHPKDGPASTLDEVLDDFAARSGLPCLAGLPFGHGPSVGVLPLGGRVRIGPAGAEVRLDGGTGGA